MPHDPLLIGLDCSTHGAKAVAWSVVGEAIAHASAPFPLSNPCPSWWEQDPHDWTDAVIAVLSRVAQQVGQRAVAIAVTHQRETFVGIDSSGEPVRPAIVWMDDRACDDVEALRTEVGEDAFHQVTGKPLSLTPVGDQDSLAQAKRTRGLRAGASLVRCSGVRAAASHGRRRDDGGIGRSDGTGGPLP